MSMPDAGDVASLSSPGTGEDVAKRQVRDFDRNGASDLVATSAVVPPSAPYALALSRRAGHLLPKGEGSGATAASYLLGMAAALVVLMAPAVAAESVTAPHLGTLISAADAAKWELNVFPDGRGLPPGHGTAAEGKPLFDTLCSSCHGEAGRGNTADELVGEPKTPTAENPTKVIGSYWPYATTLYDFIRRSMPPTAPGSLKPDEIYAVIAYLLNANGIIGEADVISNETLAKVRMPNRDGFIWIDAKP